MEIHDDLQCIYPEDECGYMADNGACCIFSGGEEICPYDKNEADDADQDDRKPGDTE